MAFVITDACRTCKSTECVDVCPIDCIHPTPDEAGFADADQLFINPDQCIDCGACAEECPSHAIYQDDDLPAGKQRFVDLNAAWFR